jgi:L,D-transpeptidase ErfK/SrfK
MGRLPILVWCIHLLLIRCSPSPIEQSQQELSDFDNPDVEVMIPPTAPAIYVPIHRNVLMKDYFEFIDSVSNLYFQNTSLPEYILVNGNAWIIDSLRSLDYYQQKKKGLFVYDHAQQTILHAGDSLLIPDSVEVNSILRNLQYTHVDVNLPEFKLRIIQGKDTVFACPVRIGKNDSAYLEFYQRKVDLRTPIGEGEIITIRKKPKFINLQTGEEYVETTRDDGRRTKMPIMPSLTPTINGKITGTLIHATTNPKSLGKASSHGCIGTSEPDIWTIYYYAPVGTKVIFRYDLNVKNEEGTLLKLSDIYQWTK